KLSMYNVEQAKMTESSEMKIRFYVKSIDNLLEAYKEQPDNFINYRLATIYLTIGNKREALEFLKRFIDAGGAKGYTAPAIKLLNNIEVEIARQKFSN
ncbi:hypothetical protein KA005_57520, partial [bacterium]|nr:hypothetical protein [bacterium]